MDGKLLIRIVATAGIFLTVMSATAAQQKASEPAVPADPIILPSKVTPPLDSVPKPMDAESRSAGAALGQSVKAPNDGAVHEQPIPSTMLFVLVGIGAMTLLFLAALGLWFFRLKAIQGELDQVKKAIDDLIAAKKLPASPAAPRKPLATKASEPSQLQNREVAVSKGPQFRTAEEEIAFRKSPSAPAPSVSPAVPLEREPPRQPVWAPPKPPEISRLALVQAVMAAVKQVAESGLSLTASNAATKVAGQISDPAIRSALAAQSFALDFFDAAGAPTAQGAELMVIGLGGSREREVLPFPNAGRVGRFMNWFDNPSYQTDPLLAEEPALAEIDSAGNLVKLTNGILA